MIQTPAGEGFSGRQAFRPRSGRFAVKRNWALIAIAAGAAGFTGCGTTPVQTGASISHFTAAQPVSQDEPSFSTGNGTGLRAHGGPAALDGSLYELIGVTGPNETPLLPAKDVQQRP